MKRRAPSFAVALAAATSLLVACGSGTSPDGSSTTPDASSKPGGSARLIDDTGRPDVPDGGGWVALVPAERIGDLWAAAGTDPGEDLTYASVPVTRAQVESVGGVARDVSEDGDFELGLTGQVVVCRVPGDGSAPSTRGCGDVELTEDSHLLITWGEAGLRVVD